MTSNVIVLGNVIKEHSPCVDREAAVFSVRPSPVVWMALSPENFGEAVPRRVVWDEQSICRTGGRTGGAGKSPGGGGRCTRGRPAALPRTLVPGTGKCCGTPRRGTRGLSIPERVPAKADGTAGFVKVPCLCAA